MAGCFFNASTKWQKYGLIKISKKWKFIVTVKQLSKKKDIFKAPNSCMKKDVHIRLQDQCQIVITLNGTVIFKTLI
jgi:hypothetical protein